MAMAMANANFSSFCIYIVVLCSISVNLVLSSAAMPGKSKSASPAVHIVFMEKPRGVEPEAYHIQTLASVLGSEKAAKEALVYSYSNAASGFSARLTPDQVAKISKQPGVLNVVNSEAHELHGGGAEGLD
ncbi:subtilisin-like protease SBT3.3 [Momordica charantia]|uniref:Subtilisin-like protease SBT3.3 n=1 Tax=Momordica charantia TaxID=3673 RepID=A0A6J1CQX4_MOMCH|nr:subtilisin-like protease SBT3.3 [Momordica charantia]